MKQVLELNRNSIVPVSTGLVLAAATAKILALLLLKNSTALPDLVFWFLQSRTLSLAVALLEFLCVFVLLDARVPRLNKLFCILVLGSCFLGYRMSQWFHFGVTSCGCFGLSLSNPLSSTLLKTLAGASVIYLLSGSLLAILGERLRNATPFGQKKHYETTPS